MVSASSAGNEVTVKALWRSRGKAGAALSHKSDAAQSLLGSTPQAPNLLVQPRPDAPARWLTPPTPAKLLRGV
jgi:hypothetical protein